MEQLLLTITSTQEALDGVGRTKIYELIKSGDLRVVKIGRRTYVPRAELESYVARLSEVS